MTTNGISDQAYQSVYRDSDQTSLKTVQMNIADHYESMSFTGDNLCFTTLNPVQSYPSSPDIQCGQTRQFSQNVEESSQSLISQILESSFQVDDVVFDRLNNELFGLVKDAYISKLLDMSENNDSTLPQYRQDLSRRARLCEHCPTGILKERRGANRSKRYAEDCYLLQQFLDGNVTNVDDLYRSQHAVIVNSQLTPARNQTQDRNMIDLKETVAFLKAEVSLLKTNMCKVNENMETLHNDLHTVKSELQSCSNIISKHLDVSNSNTDNLVLSNGILAISRTLMKLEKSRNTLSDNISALQTTVRDNSICIEQLKDAETSIKNSNKIMVNDVTQRLQDDITRSTSDTISKSEHEAVLKSVHTRLKQCEHKIASDNFGERVESVLEKFTSTISSKLDRVCNSIQDSLRLSGMKPTCACSTTYSQMIVAEDSAADLHAQKSKTREVTPADIRTNTNTMSCLTEI
ncbi:hypothetical protein DPMN_130866 [Dreissena polymorpha]|uniref:Uncharacterized protein n=1 Tax=Dreissena polymorpha TaxID=45954 RepID=A0A9D4H5V9_DREPO|nr:hypothetical protein DPMN_130866 [Dreissena polymorpha]